MKQFWQTFSVFIKNLWEKLKIVPFWKYILALLLILILAAFGVLAFMDFKFSDNQLPEVVRNLTQTESEKPTENQPSTPKASPSPRPLPSGKQTYNLSHGKDVTGPKLNQVIIDPLDPEINSELTIKAAITHTSPVTDCSLILKTDHQTNTYPLTLVEGQATDGIWQGEILINDSYDFAYYFKFNIQSETDSFEGGLTIR